MHSKKTIAELLTVIILMFYLGSCSMHTKTVEPYVIIVDSIIAPDTVNIKTVFEIRLLGVIGPNSCYSLEKVYSSVNDQKEINIDVVGRYLYEGAACAEGVVILDTKIETNVPSSGIYTIKTIQNDGTYLEKKLVAR